MFTAPKSSNFRRDELNSQGVEQRPWHLALWVCILCAGLLLFVAIVAVLVYYDRANSLLKARGELAEHSISAVVALDRNIQSVDNALTEAANKLVVLDAGGMDIHVPKVASDVRDQLIEQIAVLPGVVSMSVMDSKGVWVISSRFSKIPVLPMNPERPVWNAAIRSDGSESFVLPPKDSPLLDIETIVIAKTARAGDGRLIGVILAFVTTNELATPFRSSMGPLDQTLIARRDGLTLSSVNNASESVPGWLLQARSEHSGVNGGVFYVTDPAGSDWLGVIRETSNGQMVTIALSPQSSALAAWRERSVIVWSATVFCVLAASVLFSLWMHQKNVAVRKAFEVREAKNQLLHALSHDITTNLLNLSGLEQGLQALTHPPKAIHTVGIDQFDQITKILGHSTGEELILEFSEKLISITDSGDILARIGQDAFSVIQFDGDPAGRAQLLLDGLFGTYRSHDRDIQLGVSVGTVECASDDDWPRLLRASASAMHQAQASGSGKVCQFDASQEQEVRERLLMEQELRAAIGTDQLYMVYQPIYDIANQCIAGFESLMRWKNPHRGDIPPSLFIPIAERAGLLSVLERAMKNPPMSAIVHWPGDLFISINYSALEFRNPSFPKRLADELQAAGLAASRCVIEITESAILENDEVVLSVMHETKKLGIGLAIDDFGSAHASLSYLHQFPFDRVKIDKGFIQAMETKPNAAAIVDATISLSRQLGLQVVAEGVETREQLNRLREQECTYAQGYFIGRPMAADDVLPFLVNFQPPQDT